MWSSISSKAFRSPLDPINSCLSASPIDKASLKENDTCPYLLHKGISKYEIRSEALKCFWCKSNQGFDFSQFNLSSALGSVYSSTSPSFKMRMLYSWSYLQGCYVQRKQMHSLWCQWIMGVWGFNENNGMAEVTSGCMQPAFQLVWY